MAAVTSYAVTRNAGGMCVEYERRRIVAHRLESGARCRSVRFQAARSSESSIIIRVRLGAQLGVRSSVSSRYTLPYDDSDIHRAVELYLEYPEKGFSHPTRAWRVTVQNTARCAPSRAASRIRVSDTCARSLISKQSLVHELARAAVVWA